MRVLFLCVGNSCRSQMAEGLLRNMRPDMDVMSAGSNPCYVNPNATKVMAELGIDISNQRSKHFEEFTGQDFDYVIALCAEAADRICPVFPGTARSMIHWSYPDPIGAEGNEDEVLAVYRKVRDDIKTGIESWLTSQT
jgi:arsenate reductase